MNAQRHDVRRPSQNLRLAEKSIFKVAFDLSVEKNTTFADTYHAAWMQRRNVTEVSSWNREFDRVPGLTRIEP